MDAVPRRLSWPEALVVRGSDGRLGDVVRCDLPPYEFTDGWDSVFYLLDSRVPSWRASTPTPLVRLLNGFGSSGAAERYSSLLADCSADSSTCSTAEMCFRATAFALVPTVVLVVVGTFGGVVVVSQVLTLLCSSTLFLQDFALFMEWQTA